MSIETLFMTFFFFFLELKTEKLQRLSKQQFNKSLLHRKRRSDKQRALSQALYDWAFWWLSLIHI